MATSDILLLFLLVATSLLRTSKKDARLLKNKPSCSKLSLGLLGQEKIKTTKLFPFQAFGGAIQKKSRSRICLRLFMLVFKKSSSRYMLKSKITDMRSRRKN